jgi:hypothetical protein
VEPVVNAAVDAVANSPELSAMAGDALAFEALMGPKLGGAATEDLRTMLGFTLGRLMARGATLDDLDAYVSGVLAQLRATGQV